MIAMLISGILIGATITFLIYEAIHVFRMVNDPGYALRLKAELQIYKAWAKNYCDWSSRFYLMQNLYGRVVSSQMNANREKKRTLAGLRLGRKKLTTEIKRCYAAHPDLTRDLKCLMND